MIGFTSNFASLDIIKSLLSPNAVSIFVPDTHWTTMGDSSEVLTLLRPGHERRVAVIGGYGSFAANRAASMQREKHQVLLISPHRSTISMNEQTTRLCMQRVRSKSSQKSCEVDAISELLLQCDINEVIFIYSDDDFTPSHGSTEIGATLHCYVAALQACIGKNIPIKLYIHDSKRRPRSWWVTLRNTQRNHDVMGDFVAVPHGQQKQPISCDEQSEVKLHDVFFYSLRSYLEMFRKLYNLHATVFMN